MGSGWTSLHFSDRACSWQQCPASLKGFIFGHCRDGSVSYWLLYLFAIHALVHEGVLHGNFWVPSGMSVQSVQLWGYQAQRIVCMVGRVSAGPWAKNTQNRFLYAREIIYVQLRMWARCSRPLQFYGDNMPGISLSVPLGTSGDSGEDIALQEPSQVLQDQILWVLAAMITFSSQDVDSMQFYRELRCKNCCRECQCGVPGSVFQYPSSTSFLLLG